MEAGDPIIVPPNWTDVLPLSDYYDTSRPLEVDIGCGKGRFLACRASRHPEINFLGIDRLLRRIRKAARKVASLKLSNVRLLRIEASYAVEYLLPDDSVDAFYAFFPDPWPKRRHHRRRLFNTTFIDSLARTLKEHGTVHLATDHLQYYEEIHAVLAADKRFEPTPPYQPGKDEQTEFEQVFLSQECPIGRCSFRRC